MVGEREDLVKVLEEWLHFTMRQSMQGFIKYSRMTGLSMSQFGALFQIHAAKRCGVSHLGEDLGITSAAASQMLEKLVQQGYVLRVEDPGDRRAKRLSLTEEGERVVRGGIEARQEWLKDLADSLKPSEAEDAAAALRLLLGGRAMDPPCAEAEGAPASAPGRAAGGEPTARA